MKRRDFIGAMAGATAATALTACGTEDTPTQAAAAPQKTFKWKMVTTWPKNFPGLGNGC